MAEIKPDDAPTGAKTCYAKGVAAMERNNLAYAMDMFESVLSVEPAVLEARCQLRACAVRHVKTSPPSALSRIKNSGRVMQAAGRMRKDPLQALAGAEKLLREDPFNLKYAQLQCEAARAAGLPEAAVLTLETIREHRPPHADVLKPLADLYRELEQFDREFSCREQLAALEPANGEYARALKDAAARLTMGKAGWQKAESYRDVVRQQPDEETSALDRARRAVQADPENVEALRALADLQARNRLHDESIQTLETILKLTGNADPGIGQKLMKAHEHRLSLKMAEAEDARDTETVQQLRTELGRLRINHAAEQVKRYPNDLQLKFEYGKLLLDQEHYTDAIRQLQQACRIPQRRIRSLLYLAKAFHAKGQTQIAKEQLETALAELPDMDAVRKEVLYETGLLAHQLDDTQQALDCFREIYSVDIGYRDVAARVEQADA